MEHVDRASFAPNSRHSLVTLYWFLYDKSLGSRQYFLGRILRTLPYFHDRVRTVVVGMRNRTKEKSTEYTSKKLEEHTLEIQSIAVICSVEVQGFFLYMFFIQSKSSELLTVLKRCGYLSYYWWPTIWW